MASIRLIKLALWLMTGLMLPVTNGYAQAAKQSGAADQALRKAQGMLRQLTQEKAALTSENAALQAQVDELQNQVKQLEPLQGEVERYRAGVESLQSAASALQTQLGKSRSREQDLLNKQRQIVEQARKIQSDNQLLVAAVKEREQWIAECSEKNANLVETNEQLVEKYQDKGFWQRLGELEPFTGIASVETENIVESYQFKLEDLTVTPYRSEADEQPE